MRTLGALLLVSLLGSCDDPTIISHVDKLSHMKLSDLWAMQSDGAIPVEIHGSPYQSISAADLADALRPPANSSQQIRFRAFPAGAGPRDHPWRLVLHFNPLGPPNAAHDCKLTEPVRTNPPKATGFEVNMTFCKRDAWQAHGFLRAPKTEDGDMQAYTNALKTLMRAIFAENTDADR